MPVTSMTKTNASNKRNTFYKDDKIGRIFFFFFLKDLVRNIKKIKKLIGVVEQRIRKKKLLNRNRNVVKSTKKNNLPPFLFIFFVLFFMFISPAALNSNEGIFLKKNSFIFSTQLK